MRRSIFCAALTLCAVVYFLQNVSAQDIEQMGKSKPFALSGSLTSGFQAYHVYGISPRSANPMWNLSGSAVVSVYGLDAPLSFTIGRQGNNVSYPVFSQFGASPRWRWLTVHAGWRNMHFSPYTLAGHSFLGGGIELSPGKFRFAAMYGRLRKARSLQNAADAEFFPEWYKRTGYALRVGIGRPDRYFDVIYFRAKDDPNSLPSLIDSTRTPAENAVAGFSTRFRLGRRISFFADGAVSMFTRDQFSKPVGDSSVPNIPGLLTPRFSTRLNYAAKAGFDFQMRGVGLKATYERIMPNFETMGAYFFANDIENITITPNIGFWKGKGRLFGTVGIQRNNLLNDRSETTKRLIGNALFSLNPTPRFGMDINYMNASVNQLDGRVRLNDTIRIAMVNTNIGVMPRWTWIDTLSVHSLLVNGNYQVLNDRNPFTREFANLKTIFGTVTFHQQKIIRQWGWQAGLNYNRIYVAQITTNRYGLNVGINKSWREGSSNVNFSATANLSDINGQRDGAVLSGNAGWNLTFAQQYTLNVYVNILRNMSDQFQDFTELQGGVSLSKRF